MTQTTTATKTVTEILFFEGCYGSWYDLNEIDSDEEATEQQIEEFWANYDFKAWLNELGEEYIDALNAAIIELLNHEFDIESYPSVLVSFESTSSPKFYNFGTDRLFCHINPWLLNKCIEYAHNNRANFDTYLKANFSNRPGFISHYSDRVSDWLDKDPDRLTHIEAGSYLEFFLSPYLEDIKYDIYDHIRGNTDLLFVG